MSKDIKIIIEQVEHQGRIQLSWTAPTPFSVPDKTFDFEQEEPEEVWHIHHELNKFPAITIINGDGEQVFGRIVFVDADNLEVHFSQPIKGKAYLN